MDILPPAMKHGVSVEDINHAMRNKRLEMFYREPNTWLVIGVDSSGRFIEIVYDIEENTKKVFHAMKLRKNWYGLLDRRRR